jgi:hypothetical protein
MGTTMILGLFIASLVLSTPNTGPSPTAALSAETKQIATIIGIFPSVAGTDGDAAARRQQEMERLVAAALDVDIATAGINNEINELTEERVRLQSRSDSKVKRLTIAGILFGVAALVGELIEFDADRERLGAVIETVGAAAGIALAVRELREADHGKTKRDLRFNMLAQMLDRPALPTSIYPRVVWTYLNSELPGSAGVTPRQQLLQHWSQDKLLGKKGRDEATIDNLTSTPSRPAVHVDLRLDDIEARIDMLTDVSARIGLMKKGLRDLMGETDGEATTQQTAK